MMKKERVSRPSDRRGVTFGIVPKLLLSILCPLFAVLTLITVFLGLRSASTVNTVMNAELETATEAAAAQVEAFLDHYYGVSETLGATQLVRDVTTESAAGSMWSHELYGELLETLRLVQRENAADMDYIWVADLSTGELLQSDGAFFRAGEIDFPTCSWYQLATERGATITTESYESANGDEVVTIATPVSYNGETVAVVGMDIDLAHLQELLMEVKVGQTGYITLYDRDNLILFHPDSSVMGVNAADAGYSENMLSAIVNKEDSAAMRYTRGSTDYYGSTTPVGDMELVVLGVMPVAEYSSHVSALLRVMIIGMVCCGVLLAAVCVFIALSITRPVKRLDAAAARLAAGELDVAVDTRGRDEVADLGRNVSEIVARLKKYIDYINEVSSVLYEIGKGNLVFTLEHDYAGEFARIKDALLDIRGTLTATLTSIAQSADQVNAGAEQIASGAQALAQGATEQASSVEELASAVQELSAQATEEAGKAGEAGRFLEQIKDEVNKSNDQMETMRQAMADITTQSAAIRGIIKTIDDIAFQTNILALNAAVEAARAGEAGKGFAVVADEVRSLAGKSAEAAKKTNELIERSVQAVKRGAELTELTADSLAAVSRETKQATETIETVAQAYQGQADKLAEISSGVDQIAQVVQTNSATAEESAAASQELSGQAGMMREQISHFKLGQADGPAEAQGSPVPAGAAAGFDSGNKY